MVVVMVIYQYSGVDPYCTELQIEMSWRNASGENKADSTGTSFPTPVVFCTTDVVLKQLRLRFPMP